MIEVEMSTWNNDHGNLVLDHARSPYLARSSIIFLLQKMRRSFDKTTDMSHLDCQSLNFFNITGLLDQTTLLKIFLKSNGIFFIQSF